MKIDHPSKQIHSKVKPLTVFETFVNDYTRLFTKVNRGLLSVYKRLGNVAFVDNQIVVEIGSTVDIRELRI